MAEQIFEDQLIELQSRVTFQEDTLQHLNQVVSDQDEHIRLLQLQVQALSKQIKEVSYGSGGQEGKPGEDRPPHY